MVVFVGFLISITLLVLAVVLPVAGQAEEAIGKWGSIQTSVTEKVKDTVGSAQEYVGTGIAAEYYQKGIDWLGKEAPSKVNEIGAWLWSRVSGVFGFFGYMLGLLMVPIYLFFFLKEGRHISQRWSDYVPLRESEFKDEVVGTLTEINGYLISFDPNTERQRIVLDVNKTCGLTAQGYAAQAKIHTRKSQINI